VVISALKCLRARRWNDLRALFALGMVISLSACATADVAKMRESRKSFLASDFAGAEKALYSPEIFENKQNRLQHFLMLSSIAMSEGHFEKAAYFLQKSRDWSNEVRSDHAGFEWFESNYGGNPIEFSYIHHFLVLSYQLLADAGSTPAWSTPEIKDKGGLVLVQAQNFPARTFSPKEIADFRSKARSELMAWDSHFENLKRSFAGEPYYQSDVWAKLLASYVHGTSSSNSEKRTGEILLDQALEQLKNDVNGLPTLGNHRATIEKLAEKLQSRFSSKKNGDGNLFVCEVGVVDRYKIQKYHLGLSTLFKGIEDPFLRSQLESIGWQVLMHYAPEFGLTVYAGGIVGALGGGDSDEDDEAGPPKFFTDSVDSSLGFQISFPTIRKPDPSTRMELQLAGSEGKNLTYALPIVSPLQEILSHELEVREKKQMLARGMKIGVQYLAALVTAVSAYRAADQEGNGLKKLAIIAGYFFAKKAIDRANRPDLRSWDTLPFLLAADYLDDLKGDYQATIRVRNESGEETASLGTVRFGKGGSGLIWKRIPNLPLLNAKPRARAVH
jgi:hypothetical protein